MAAKRSKPSREVAPRAKPGIETCSPYQQAPGRGPGRGPTGPESRSFTKSEVFCQFKNKILKIKQILNKFLIFAKQKSQNDNLHMQIPFGPEGPTPGPEGVGIEPYPRAGPWLCEAKIVRRRRTPSRRSRKQSCLGPVGAPISKFCAKRKTSGPKDR